MTLLLLSSIFVWVVLCDRCAASFAQPSSAGSARLSLSDEKERLIERLIIRAKRLRPEIGYPLNTTRFYGSWTKHQVIEGIFSIFVPPVAVFIHGGHDFLIHFVVNVILWILGYAMGPVVVGWVPGSVYAFWYCFFRNTVF